MAPRNADLIVVMAAVAALVVSGHVAGRLLTRRIEFAGVLERGVVATAVGLAALAHLALAAALAGALRPAPVAGCFLVLNGLGWAVWRESWREARRMAARLRRACGERPALVIFGAVALAAAALPFVLLPLYPPTAFDATLYHLPYVRGFVRAGAAPFMPDLRAPIFPQLNELLMSLTYLFAGDLGAQLTMAVATLLSAALAFLWGRSAFPGSKVAAAGAAAAFLGNPIIMVLAGTAYIEPGLVLWVTASLYAVHRFRRGGGKGWIVLAAVFAGCAASCKYLGLFFVAVAWLAVLARGWRARTLRRRLADGLLFALVAGLVLAPWYGRIVAATGNPVFPFFADLFGHSAWDPSSAAEDLGGTLAHPPRPPGGTAVAGGSGGIAALPRLALARLSGWKLTGLTVPPSPWYLLAAPLLLLAAWREPRLRLPLLLVAVYAAVLIPLPADVRYLTPVLPVASVALAGALAYAAGDLARLPEGAMTGREKSRDWRKWGPWALAAILLLPGWVYGINVLVRQGPVPVGPTQRDSYLARELPLYPALQALNRARGSRYTVYAFYAENMAYYADGRFLGDWNGPASFLRLPPPTGDPDALYVALRRLGADHLLVPNSPEVTTATATPAFRRRFRPFYRDAAARVFAFAPAGAAAPGS
jgi:4-amino-4-deoxy-L-arabinose transferase-like glycosyltransferase